MCGFVAIINTGKFNKLNDLFPDLFTAIQVRGTDGCGIYGVKNGNTFSRKSILDSVSFMREAKTRSLVNSAEVLVGHVRKATTGSVNVKNTHPFKSKHITLAHNGVLQDHKTYANVECDSEAACIAIANNGEDIIQDLEGAYAFLWLDKTTFKMVRNVRRTLFIAETHHGFVIASERKLIEWVCDRNNVHIKNIYPLPIEEIWTYNKDKETFDKKDLPSESYSSSYLEGGYAGWWNKHSNHVTARETPKLESKVVHNFRKENYTYGDTVLFRVVSLNKEQNMISGRMDDGRFVRYYDKNHVFLERLAKKGNLQGTLSAFAQVHGESGLTFYVKDVQ